MQWPISGAGMPKLFRNQRDALRLAKAGNDFYQRMFSPDKPTRVVYPPEKPKRAAPVRDPRRVSEADVLKAVWKYLSHHPKVAWCTRVNSGTWQHDDRYVRFNYKRGMADLIGMMKSGQFLAVECKSPTGMLMDHQRDFLNEVRLHNGVAFVARSITDAERELA
jgi:hypothetical protein